MATYHYRTFELAKAYLIVLGSKMVLTSKACFLLLGLDLIGLHPLMDSNNLL